METVKQIIESNGGFERLPTAPLLFHIDADNLLVMEDRGPGPNGRRAISLTSWLRPNGRLCRSEVLLEVTDLGLLPFFLRSHTGEVMRVYRMDRRRRIKQIRHDVRARLVQKTNEWDEWLADYLEEQEVLST